MKYDFNIKKLENKIQIKVDEWIYPSNNILTIHEINGKSPTTYITKAKSVGTGISNIKEGDCLLLSKVACDVATTLGVPYTVNGNKFFDTPVEQIIGVFKDNIVDTTHLSMMNKNILFKRLIKHQDSTLLIEEKNTMLGEVIKTCENSSLKKGDTIAIQSNVSTPIRLEEEYFAVEEKFIVGTFKESLSIKDMKVLNEYVIMKPYISENVLNSTILKTPDMNYDELDYSDINNRNLFKVVYADNNLKEIKKGDIILTNRNYTNYLYYENEKYFVINDKNWILGKIIERDKQCN